jgi:hypothetical protein
MLSLIITFAAGVITGILLILGLVFVMARDLDDDDLDLDLHP